MARSGSFPVEFALRRERRTLLRQLERGLETPLFVLGLVWLALLVVEFTAGLNRAGEWLGWAIWAVFVADFLLKLALAPDRLAYARRHWLVALSLLAPALRVLRVLRVARLARLLRLGRAARGLRLLRVLASLNRGMRALGATMGRRGFGYALALTVLVVFVGAAGMLAFENENPDGRGLPTYGAALWWTAMLMTTLGSEYWPQTLEGRVLCFALALYAFAVFGYLTAALSSFFLNADADDDRAALAGARSVEHLRREIVALRAEVRALGNGRGRDREPGPPPASLSP